jgi:hypothetical protein
MQLSLRTLTKSSTVLLLYVLSFLTLSWSVTFESGPVYLPLLTSYLIALCAAYVVCFGVLGRFRRDASPRAVSQEGAQAYDALALCLLGATVAFILLHFWFLGEIPVLSGALNNDYYEIMRVRQRIFEDVPAFYRYGPNILIKSVFPFLILYMAATRQRLAFFVSTIVAVTYGASLMNKLFIIVPVVPAALYLAYNKRVVPLLAIACLSGLALWALVLVQNPHIRPAFWTAPGEATISGRAMVVEVSASEQKVLRMLEERKVAREEMLWERKVLAEAVRIRHSFGPEAAEQYAKANGLDLDVALLSDKYVWLQEVADFGMRVWLTVSSPFSNFVDTIYIRVFLIPGQVISAWFRDIPAAIPFGEGCGSRLIASVVGCDLRSFPKLVHDLENPELAAAGIHGTMTAASFMEDYANFGERGMVGGALVMGALFALIALIYRDDWKLAFLLNFIPVALLMELPLSTVLLTGGWAVSIALYLIFRKRLQAIWMTNES